MSCSEWRSGKRSPGPKRNKVKDFTLQSDSGEEGHSWADQQSPNVDNVAEMAMADRNYPKLMKPSEYIYEQVQLRLKVDAPVKLPELAILRGDNLDLSSKEEEEQLELARHRRETGHRAAQDQRQMARKRGIHRMRHEQAMRLLTKSNLLNERHERRKMHRKNQRRFETPEPLEEEEEEDAEYSDFVHEAESSANGKATAFTSSAAEEVQPAADEAAETHKPTFPDAQCDEITRKSILSFLSHKTDKDERITLLRRANKNRREQDRLGRLIQVRRMQFESKPVDEREALTKAFGNAQKMSNTSVLDCKQLRRALDELGLSPKTDTEKKEVKLICDEVAVLGDVDFLVFVFEAVPRAREKLKEMRRGPLLQQFQMFDTDDSGHLSEEECFQIFERLYTFNLDAQGTHLMQTSFQEAMDELKDPQTCEVNFEGFEVLMSAAQEGYHRILRERETEIMTKNCLTMADVVEFPDELVSLHDSFLRANLDGGEEIDRQELRMLLIEYGLYPRSEEGQQQVDEFLSECDGDSDGQLSFAEFLLVIRNVRYLFKQNSAAELRKVFDGYDKDRSGTLNMSEVSLLLGQLGLMPRCREDQAEMKRLLDCIDDDGSGLINFPEFQMLVQRVTERINAAKRRRERDTATKLHYAEGQVSELRDAFYALDSQGTGILSVDKLRKALDLLRLPMSAEDLQKLLDRLDTGFVGGLDFEKFLHFMSEVTTKKK
mmetsp:Transcript_18257/g.33941  ORF Transcript_18257/g.33941 Transcript_18257/m.33941 type:complete len:718 (-) Transcript_18257:44-2197(-)